MNLTADGSTGIKTNSRSTIWQLDASGTFGGGTVSLEKRTNDDVWIPLGDETLDAPGSLNVEVSRFTQLRATLTGSAGADVNLIINPMD